MIEFDRQDITLIKYKQYLVYSNDSFYACLWSYRELATAVKGSTSISYKYGADGLRTKKTVGSTVYNYYYADGRLVRQTWGSNYMDFLYDEGGNAYSFVYNGTQYYYVRNIQGDVVRILNTSGTTVVAYSYDAWGKCTVTTGASNAIANANPIRYRGYYYDTDTGFYYLQSRYYDPTIKRFINADDASLLGANGDFTSLNLYAYCGNNPVARADEGGEAWHILVGAAISAGIDIATQLICNGGDLGSVDWGSVGISAVSGAISSAFGLGVEVIAGKAKHAVTKSAITILGNGLSNIFSDGLTGEINSLKDAGNSFLDGALTSAVTESFGHMIRGARKTMIDSMDRSAKKAFLTNNVFKKGNNYYNWTWNNYSSSPMYEDYLNKGVNIFEEIYSNGMDFLKGVFG